MRERELQKQIMDYAYRYFKESFDPNRIIKLNNYMSFEIPYDTGLSKNKLYFGRSNIFRSPAYKTAQEQIIEQIIFLSKKGKKVFFDRNKIWLDVFVEKLNLRSDAINLVDGICDAVKKAIGVDDRWFSIRRVDWSIVKNDPKILIGIGQEEERFFCSNCGRFVSLDKRRNKSSCKECFEYRKITGE